MRIWFIFGVLFSREFSVNPTAVEPKIVHGIPAGNMKEFGYSVYFVSFGGAKVVCGGSIISQRTVLTAAHCIRDAPRHQAFFIRVGSHDKEQGIPYEVKDTVVHERYDPIKVTYDIGLAAVGRDIEFDPTVYRVALSNEPARTGLLGTVAGWGIFEEGLNEDTQILLYAKQKILPLHRCEEIMKVKMRPKTFCAGEKYANRYPSRGDSGAPLVLEGNVQIGILSASAAAGVTIYTDVSQFLNWIDFHTKRLYCQ